MGRDNDFAGKVIALTGGASGIGLAAAQSVFARGGTVAIADIDPSALTAAQDAFASAGPERVLCTRVDVSKRDQVDQWIASVVAKFGRLDGAVNSAGVIGKHHGTRKVWELEDDQWDLIMGVNLTGMMYCMRAQLKVMADKGSVVCVSSVQGVMGFAGHAAYSASKHGVIGLARCAAKEAGARGIRVNVVTPGSIATPLMDKRNALEGVDKSHFKTPIDRVGSAEECGNVIAWLLSDEAAFCSGGVHACDGGWAC